MGKKKSTFEESLAELEAIIQQMEGDELPLGKMMEQYEKGVKALEHCRKVLDEAEKKIEVLVKTEDGKLRTEPFQTENEE